MADIDDFDIDRSIAQAWTEFQTRLSEIISVIDDSGDLTIGTESESDDPAPFVRLACPERDVVRAEAASNAVLGDDFQLTAAQNEAMQKLGWEPPTSSGPRPTPNFWAEVAQEESDRLAYLTVAALRDVYGVQHPIFLAPDQLAEVLQPGPTPIEGPVLRGSVVELDAVDLTSTMPRSPEHLNELVDAELTTMFGHPPIRDVEGDVAIRVGSTMLFLRTAADGQDVVVFAAVVHDVAGRSRAMEVLNDLNVDARWVKFQLVRDRVFVTVSVLARPFVPAHLHQAVRILSDVADGIDEELATKLNGRTTFTEPDEH
ncbi:MAG: hypothetical protein JWP61_2667 [Friedmanniella sp.]|nr:hypothetical protein [Friedmanniella sp.]